jgi:hypothetical protein
MRRLITVSRLWSSRPTDKWQHRFSSRIPTVTEFASRQFIKSAKRNTVESNMRHYQQKKERTLIKGKLMLTAVTCS